MSDLVIEKVFEAYKGRRDDCAKLAQDIRRRVGGT